MAKISIETMRKLILESRGGHSKATDGQIRILWNSLPAAEQERLLAKETDGAEKKKTASRSKPKEVTDAPSDKQG
tara:strand:+ start:623 stop:847 length:225 start_codon:yes stop_codon:yes gene_type:complete